MSASVPQILATHAATLSTAFDTLLAQQTGAPARIIEAVRYSLDAGGKRLRPALVLETFDAVFHEPNPPPPGPRGSPPPRPSTRPAALAGALAAAVAIELIHTFSLVHDDLPAMDDDDLRRGRPTNHKVFGEAVAILAGDAMMTLAFETLARRAPADRVGPLVAELARATGPAGMIGGQVLDMAGEGQTLDLAGLQAIHRLKTGALLTGACRLGAIAAGADAATLAAVTAYGDRLGLAFQITDDVLDETATPQQLGKATNKDAGRGKNTYPRLIGLEASKRAAAEQIDAALDALASLNQRGSRLAALARFVGQRQV
ncbi:MAG TPA: farnesyl diphosphate synthase [Tepidisphaeraceae bacterium]|jgi:geranylgeranyl diphosphate synthase type II